MSGNTMTFADFSQKSSGWGRYKAYLADRGALSFALTANPDVPPYLPKLEAVPWSSKAFQEIVDAGILGDLEQHIAHNLPEHRIEGYIKYLVVTCKFPPDWVNYLRTQVMSKVVK